jgi:hypothetical protein
MLDGVAVFTLVSHNIVEFKIFAFDFSFSGHMEIPSSSIENLVDKLIETLSERYLDDTVKYRIKENITLH